MSEINPYRDEEVKPIPEQYKEIHDELESVQRRKIYLLHQLYLLDTAGVERLFVEDENS